MKKYHRIIIPTVCALFAANTAVIATGCNQQKQQNQQ